MSPSSTESRVRDLMVHPEWAVYPSAEYCPDADTHTPMPSNYADWHVWAFVASRTKRQKQCPKCGFFVIWIDKSDA